MFFEAFQTAANDVKKWNGMEKIDRKQSVGIFNQKYLMNQFFEFSILFFLKILNHIVNFHQSMKAVGFVWLCALCSVIESDAQVQMETLCSEEQQAELLAYWDSEVKKTKQKQKKPI